MGRRVTGLRRRPSLALSTPDGHVSVDVDDRSAQTLPWSLEEHRARVLETCGLTPAIFRQIGRVIDQGMGANVVQRLVVSGGRGEPSTVQEFIDVDHRTRLAAAREAGEILGVKPSRSAPAARGKVEVKVAVAPWLKPTRGER